MRVWLRSTSVGVITLCAAVGAEAKVNFILDYSLEAAGGLFDAGTTEGQQARAAMQRAARVFSERLLDDLTAISPGGGNTWSPRVVNPGSGQLVTPALSGVGANDIRVYVGSRLLGDTEVALTNAGTAAVGGTQAFIDNAASRGEAGALASPQTDIGPWGGSIAFDWGTNWHFGATTGGLTTALLDFHSVAIHELAHLLGFSSLTQPSSFTSLVSGGKFNGPKAKAANGGAAPDVSGSHWVGMNSRVGGAGGAVQAALMNPGLPTGVRRRMTLLDWAALDDVGWSLAIPGDANANGVVNFTDFQMLERGWGKPGASWVTGDFNEDGVVDDADFRILYGNLGRLPDGTLSPTAAADREAMAGMARALGVEVPEPGTAATLLLLGLGLTMMRRGRP